MAERHSRGAPAKNCGVSFQKFGSCRADSKSEDSEAAAGSVALEPSGAEQRHVSASRKVSKISATATAEPKKASSAPLSSISPSIRQLTEKFSSSSSSSSSGCGGGERTQHARPGDAAAVQRESRTRPRVRRSSSLSRLSLHPDGGAAILPDNKSFLDKVHKFNSAADSLSVSDSERKSKRWTCAGIATDSWGKKTPFFASDHPKSCLDNDEEDVKFSGPSKAHRTYRGSEFSPLNSDKWPSVTKIRQLFDERPKQSHTCEDQQQAGKGDLGLKSDPERAPLSDKNAKLSSYSSVNAAKSLCSSEGSLVEGQNSAAVQQTLCDTMDLRSKIYEQQYALDEEARLKTSGYYHETISGENKFQNSSVGTCCQDYHREKSNSSPFRSHSPSSEAKASSKTPTLIQLTPDPHPDLQTSATTSQSGSVSQDPSFCASFLQKPIVREKRVSQGVGLARDSLHSSHSSSTAPAPLPLFPLRAPAPDKAITSSSTAAPSSAPVRVDSLRSSRWRFSSGDEEEERSGKKRGGVSWRGPSHPFLGISGGEGGVTEQGGNYLSRSKNGRWNAQAVGRSSGSEEESPGSLGSSSKEAVRRRSLRKKKRFCGGASATGRDDYNDHDSESDESDSKPSVTMEPLDRPRHMTTGGEFFPRVSRSHSARESTFHSNRARMQQQWERISCPVASTTLPGVSRVAKVSIPPFGSSSGGSRYSSRYSSTETLKAEDPVNSTNRGANTFLNTGGDPTARNASSSMLSKTYYGNFTMYRSPSFGHGDNFPRTQVRTRPKIVPVDSSPSGVLTAEGRLPETVTSQQTTGGDSADVMNGISKSNPDITTETMTLLNFLKSDISDLKVRKTGEEMKCGLAPLSHVGTPLPSGRRLSLKDLTATLRRAKSFTYSGKSPTAVRCYLASGTTKRSTSEQELDLDREKNGGRLPNSDREVESDSGDFRLGRGRRFFDYGYDDPEEDVMPTPLQEKYVQEARQVIQDICQMNTREDDDIDITSVIEDNCLKIKKTDEEKRKGMHIGGEAATDKWAEFKTTTERDKHEQENGEREKRERDGQSMQPEKLNRSDTEYQEKVKRQSRETARVLLKGDSEESVCFDRSVDELSGHESSLTDEGIVTEPEIGPADPSEKAFLRSGRVNLGACIARDVLGQPVTIWKQSVLHEEKGLKKESEEMMENNTGCTVRLNEVCIPPSLLHPSRAEELDCIITDSVAGLNCVDATNEASNSSGSVPQASAVVPEGFEAPDTPSAVRRRRKFSPSNNSNGASEGSYSSTDSTAAADGIGDSTVYRSLSDPMPQRCSTVAEEDNFSSVDSNLLGSLGLKSPAVPPFSEHKGSVASDLSVYSDGGLWEEVVGDYSGVIRSIVAEPGAVDRVMTDYGNGKAPKKKSFSDPSRRSDAALLSYNDSRFKGQSRSTGPINELDQVGAIPPSSSEPILNKHQETTWEAEGQPKVDLITQSNDCHRRSVNIDSKRAQSQSGNPDYENNVIDQSGQKKAAETRRFNFDLKLAEALSPRMVRRSPRKRPNRLAHFFSHEEPLEPPELEEQVGPCDAAEPAPLLPSSKSKTRPKHVRHASEPATFIPISPPPRLHPLKKGSSLSDQPAGSSTAPSKLPVDKVPSLEDVTPKSILDIGTPERDADSPGPLPGSRDGAEGSVSSSEGPSEIFAGQTSGAVPQKGLDNAPSVPAPQRTKPRVDMRKHVMMTLLDTERSYVESLRSLIQGYMRPLKQPDGGSIVDPLLVDEMFYQIPEILEHHERFLEQVDGCVNRWHDRQTVGDLLIQSFSKETLANTYSAYIDNFLNAKDAVRIAKEAKPAFHKFLEQNMRENKEKQALGDLMIKPVQRIPRYELLVKDLLKHTPDDHPDHSFLLDAQRDIKRLAEKINKGRRSAEEAEREARVIQEIEAHIEGVEHILNPQRKFIRQEMVMEAKTVGGKKDRSLFLFSDLIICTTLKRKSGSLRRSSMSLYSATSVIDTSSKYKFLWKLPLEDVEVVKSSTQSTNKENVQKTISRLDEDLSTLGQISKLSESLSLPHQSLDEVIKDLMASVHRELSEKQSLAFSMTFLPTKLEFTSVSAESSFVFEFTSPDIRSNFEQAFEEAKKKLAVIKDQWDPEFLKAIPIMKTRSGMQFSCASPSHTCPDNGCEVWVCNSDGYVGQVCLLNIKDEPTVEACIAVCSARIICIAAVPGLKGRDRGPEAAIPPTTTDHTQQQLHISISHSSLELTEQPTGPGAELVPFDSDDTDDDDSPSPSSTLQSQASHSTISSSYGIEEAPCSKDLATETTSSEEEQDFSVTSSYSAPGMLAVSGGGRANTESPMDGRAMRRSSRGSFTRASLEDLLSIDPEAYQSSVWLGTEDGCIHVYQSSDNIRNRKNSMKMQHAASILCILYLDNKVFVSLANGEVIVYQRQAGSFWDSQSSQTLVLGTPSSPVTKMVPVGGKLWCGSQNRILIINSTTLAQEHSFQVGTDSSRCVTCMVVYGQGVWLALQGSAHVKLYHAQTWESLTEVDVAPAVHKMLAGADAIIRQHKAACLRITALLACKDLLWIGTSAGVVLTLVIPAASSGTGTCAVKSPLVPMGSAHGHTGHVRFLTTVELPEGLGMNFPSPTLDPTGKQSQGGAIVDGHLQRHDSARRRSSTHLPPKTNQLVISGGDGYEDFRLNNSSETIGRDDSTNHLLVWRV
ncbi:rho guanine nucleotide exchange factor 17-like [Syngnathoides biaculeatus]|uniref:rho guanine nucleotide exchange factor 17-like n=1 Tax=Syngnathoides biaculeatus TaxID=300417 RepID=UPI002ADD576D|nr:rho guanine nucleotide exchange factor 17-like [Syngnathoides biaculeatus]